MSRIVDVNGLEKDELIDKLEIELSFLEDYSDSFSDQYFRLSSQSHECPNFVVDIYGSSGSRQVTVSRDSTEEAEAERNRIIKAWSKGN